MADAKGMSSRGELMSRVEDLQRQVVMLRARVTEVVRENEKLKETKSVVDQIAENSRAIDELRDIVKVLSDTLQASGGRK